MTKEEAKVLLVEANELCQGHKYQEALILLNQVRSAFPDSGRVAQQQAVCLVALGRLDEAELLCPVLEQLSGTDAPAIRTRILAARGTTSPNRAPTPQTERATDLKPPLIQSPVAENEFFVESVSPVSTEETCVMGHVANGAFFTGSMVSVITSEGLPLLAPIVRLGTQYAPLNVIRKGPLATMFLQIESQHVAVGAKIFSSDSGAAQAPTMIVLPGAASAKPVPSPSSPELVEARRLIDQRAFNDARKMLEAALAKSPNDFEAHRLRARLALEADQELYDPKLAMQHIAKSYEIAGHGHPEVIEVLAQTLGANGQCEHGLRHLERLFEMASDMEKKDAYAKRITAYRARYQIPDVWQFIDSLGTVILESSDPEKIKKAIANRNIPENAKFRKNKVSALIPVKEWHLPQSDARPAETAFIQESTATETNHTLSKLIGALIGVLLAAGINLFVHIESTPLRVISMIVAGAIGWILAGLVGNRTEK